MTVYRTNVAPARRATFDALTSARRSSLSALPPLLVIAVTFFLPMTEGCHEKVSPVSFARFEGLGPACWIVPPFAAAAALVGALLASWWEPRTKLVVAIAATHAASTLFPVVGLMMEDKTETLLVVGHLLVTVCAALLLLRALRRRSWGRVSRLLDVYVVASLPIACLIAITATYVGAFLFTAAYVALVVQRLAYALSVRRARDRRET